MKDIQILDSTLRDGAQAEGISFTLHDKLDIVRRLDQQSVAYIEAGNPFSNPKDMEFFSIADRLALENAKLVAFGSTRRRELRAEEDPGLRALLQANTDTVAIFGKSSVMQVTEVLNTSLENNLQMILDTVYFLKQQGKTVFFDAEHFFDGYKGSAEYALSCLEAAQTGGADLLVLCDTNGGCFPDEAARITAEVCSGELPDGGRSRRRPGAGDFPWVRGTLRQYQPFLPDPLPPAETGIPLHQRRMYGKPDKNRPVYCRSRQHHPGQQPSVCWFLRLFP